jgi:toxin ParE1/3/4
VKPYEISTRAEADLRSIWHYVAADSESAADRLIRRFTAMFDRLARNPHLGRSRSEIGQGYRCYPLREYLIFYKVEDQLVLITHVVHGRRDLESYPFDAS